MPLTDSRGNPTHFISLQCKLVVLCLSSNGQLSGTCTFSLVASSRRIACSRNIAGIAVGWFRTRTFRSCTAAGSRIILWLLALHAPAGPITNALLMGQTIIFTFCMTSYSLAYLARVANHGRTYFVDLPCIPTDVHVRIPSGACWPRQARPSTFVGQSR